MKTERKNESLKDKVKKELAFSLIVGTAALAMPNAAQYELTSAALQSGASREFIEIQYRKELPKEKPYIGRVAEFVGRPGRELAYATVKQHKFPWKGYKRHIFQ
jgi:hypothetical protein